MNVGVARYGEGRGAGVVNEECGQLTSLRPNHDGDCAIGLL